MTTIKITHCDPDSKRAITITPISEQGRICGLPQQIQPGESGTITVHAAMGYTVSEHPIDMLCVKAKV